MQFSQWQASPHCKLEQGNAAITRTRATDGQWVLMRVEGAIIAPGKYRLRVRNDRDSSGDGCWMLGIAVASRKSELARDWGGPDQYQGLQMIRSDCGQVWANGPQAEKLGRIGRIEGHEALAGRK